MACNCGGTGNGATFQLVKADGGIAGTFLTRTEAIAALTAAGTGHRVVTATAKG